MMPCFHAQQCAYATSESRPPEQGRFLNAPSRSLGFPFIDAVQKKRHDIDAGKVDQDAIEEYAIHYALILVMPTYASRMRFIIRA